MDAAALSAATLALAAVILAAAVFAAAALAAAALDAAGRAAPIVALVDAAITLTAAAFAAAAPGAASLAAATIALDFAFAALATAAFASSAPAITALAAAARTAVALAVAAVAGSNGSCADGTTLPGIPGSYDRVARPDGTFGLHVARVIELGSALRALGNGMPAPRRGAWVLIGTCKLKS